MTIDERIAAELRRHAPQVDEHDAWDKIRSLVPVRRRGRAIWLVPISVAALGCLVLGFLLVRSLSSGPAPASDPGSPFLGTWVTIDGDGSTPTMTIGVSGDGAVEIEVVDDFASVCSGAPSTMTGTGRLEGATELVIPTPVLTCDDGSEPVALSGPPLHEQLLDLTFNYDLLSGALTDNFGSVWERPGAEEPSPESTAAGMWPQSSLEEVQEAQRLADAGDPDYTWQLVPALAASYENPQADLTAEFFARFLREELGWEEYQFLRIHNYNQLVFVRCAQGQTNPLYPNDPRGSGCAPTIDEFRYETVWIFVAQFDGQGQPLAPLDLDPAGIWVVMEWEMIEPAEQVVPPSKAEVTALLQAFLGARVDGEGALEYFHEYREIPLLYATTTGAPYEHFEFEPIDDFEWPVDDGRKEFKVRLFAEGGETVVEQWFFMNQDESGRLQLKFLNRNFAQTTENGQAVPEQFSFLDGEVTFAAAWPWVYASDWEHGPTVTGLNFYDVPGDDGWSQVYVVADPLPLGPGCQAGPIPADAAELARAIGADPDLEATEPIAVLIAGVEALQIDVQAAPGASLCEEGLLGVQVALTKKGLPDGGSLPFHLPGGYRIRLHLLDLPGGPARILAIAILGPEARFEQKVEAAAPILDSIELHAP